MAEKKNKKTKKNDKEILVNQLKILQADFDNYKKRVEKERKVWDNKAKAELIKKIVPIVDDLKKATIHSKDEGIKLIYKNFLSILKKEGVKQIEAKGKKFDIRLHEAVMIVNSDLEDNTIVDVVEDGYIFNEILIRPAKVVVNRKK